MRLQLHLSISCITLSIYKSKLKFQTLQPTGKPLNQYHNKPERLLRSPAMACDKEEANVGVKIISKSFVKPIKPLGRKEYVLTTFDLPYLAFYYNQKFLLYKCDVGEFKQKVEKLKQGLSVVLEDFHQLAGRLGRDEEGVFRIEYDDDMEGVEVLEAEGEGTGVEDLSGEEGPAKLKEFIPCNGMLNLEGQNKPLLVVQLAKLKDGIAMGLAFNHAVLDGTSTWHFMNSWAEICRGSDTISVPPFLDRTKARDTRVKLDLSAPPDPISDSTATPPKLREKFFKFSEAKIDKIKASANASLPPDATKPFSTFQSLAAHVWRHATKARNLEPDAVTVFTFFTDCRRRVDPPVPESYFGNLIHAVFTGTAAGLLLAHPPHFGASVIQKAIEGHDSKAIQARNEEWESAPKIFQFKDAGMNCVAVGSSPRFKIYDIDLGFGEPEIVRGGTNNRFDGMMYLYRGKAGGRSIDVEITLETEAMEQLEKDKEFLLED